MYIKNNFKFLIFKIFIGDYITNSSKRHGIIIKNNGEYFTVKYLDGKIHSDIHRSFLYYSLPDLKVSDFPIKSDAKITYGSKVAVISHEKKYANLEITSSGIMNLKINFRPNDLNTISFQNIENVVLYKVNEFVKKINKNHPKILDIQNVSPFYKYVNTKYPVYKSVKNLHYYIDIEYPLNLSNYKKQLSNIIKCFYPLVTLVNDDILLGQEVEFLVKDKVYRGVVEEIKKDDKSIVKSYDGDIIYNVENNNIFPLKNKSNNHILHLKYKKISGYEKMSPLQSFIRRNI